MLELKSPLEVKAKKAKKLKMKRVKTMKNITKKLMLASLLLASATPTITHNANAYDDAITHVCVQYKKCGSNVTVWNFKAVSKHKMNDVLYKGYYEETKQTLKPGAFYEVVFLNDSPYKIYKISDKKITQKLAKKYTKVWGNK